MTGEVYLVMFDPFGGNPYPIRAYTSYARAERSIFEEDWPVDTSEGGTTYIERMVLDPEPPKGVSE